MLSFHSILDTGPGSIDPATFAPIARDNRKRFVANVAAIAGITTGAVFLKGGEVTYRYNTDVELPFRQESNFLWVTKTRRFQWTRVLIPCHLCSFNGNQLPLRSQHA